ncbi:MAG: proton-conducting transporter membrane subunit, partial [Fidelibacterota bacterium]
IHGMGGIQDMRRMGGLKGVMPKTYWSMLVGVGAISGVPLLSGFFSKDEILWNVYSSPLGGDFLTMAGVFTAAITAFYMFRLFFMTFHGERRWDTGVTPHDAPSVMTVPVMVLAFLALIGGYTGVPESLGGGNIFHHFIQLSSPDSVGMGGRLVPGSFLSENVLMVFSVLAAVVGFGLAFQLCLRQPGITEKVSRKLPGVYAVLSRKYFVDEIYDALFVQLLRKGSEVVWRAFDLGVIDRIVNGSGKWVLALGGRLRRVQTGVVQNYAAVFLLGVILIVFYVYLR